MLNSYNIIRQHYVQLQIFKNADGSLGARIIDSTANRILIPKDEIEKLLNEVKSSLSILFGTAANKDISVSVVHTSVQITGKECGEYVIGGMQATTNMCLAQGPDFLHDNAKTKKIVMAEHKCVDNMETQNYLLSRIPADSFEKPVTQSEDVQPTNLGETKTLSVIEVKELERKENEIVFPDLSSTHLSSTDDDELSSVFSNDIDFEEIRREENIDKIATAGKIKILETPFETVSKFVNEMKGEDLQKALLNTFKNYQKNRRTTAVSFFRQYFDAGLDYMKSAEARLKSVDPEKKEAIAKQIATEILAQGLKGDGMEIKENSRVDWLLRSMQQQLLLTNEDGPLKGRIPLDKLQQKPSAERYQVAL